MRNKADPAFWQKKSVFLTGHTGFMGGWLAATLHALRADIAGYSLPPPTDPSFYKTVGVAGMLARETIADIRALDTLVAAMKAHRPEVVFHLAAQPLVREAFRDPVETFSANVMGTVNVLEAVRHCPGVKAVVVVTSDKVYDNVEWEWDFRETDRLGGREPYGVSKACTELVIDAYRHSYLEPGKVQIASVRAGNVIGGGDWAAERLIPDIVRAFSAGQPLMVRNPDATRPWQHVLEPIRGYLMLAERLCAEPGHFATGWNFGPERDDQKPVSWIADFCVANWGGKASWQLEGAYQPYEAKRLGVSSARSEARLKWLPRWRIDTALRRSLTWYQAALSGGDMRALTQADVAEVVL